MGKFAIECPHCGKINQASTSLFAKRIIKCGFCGDAIDVKASKQVFKKCPNCDSVFAFNQKKNNNECPICGVTIARKDMGATQKHIVINCPECACAIEVNESDNECPICGCEIDVKKEQLKSRLVSDTGVSVIQYEGDNSTFVWKHPIEDFNLGSQLIVHESQEAIFFLNGEALDSFGPGRHTLETENLPVLKKIYALPTGSQTPFHAEIYFVNLTVQMGLKWGTDSKVRFIDQETGIPLDIGASGELNLQVQNARKLLIKLVGTTGGITNKRILQGDLPGEIKEADKALKGYFRAPIQTQVKSFLANVIKEENINIMEIDAHMEELSSALRDKISPAFEEYGLFIPQFYITNILLPEDDKNFKDLKALRASAYIGVKAEQTKASIAEAARQRQLIEEQTKAQLRMVEAQGEAEAAKLKGFAEAEVMRAKGYTEKDVLQADVQKAYAEGLGDMGSGSGGGGSLASDIVGMMAGMKMAGKAFDQFDVFDNNTTNNQSASAADNPAKKWTCECGETENTKGFCMNCGKPRPNVAPESTWNCPSCGATGITSKFCPECGQKKPEAGLWDCSNCGEKNIKSKFCPECGAKKPE